MGGDVLQPPKARAASSYATVYGEAARSEGAPPEGKQGEGLACIANTSFEFADCVSGRRRRCLQPCNSGIGAAIELDHGASVLDAGILCTVFTAITVAPTPVTLTGFLVSRLSQNWARHYR
jgi:hypothetical protein